MHSSPVAAAATSYRLSQNLLAVGGIRHIRTKITRASAVPPAWTLPWSSLALVIRPASFVHVLDECDRERFAPGTADIQSQQARLDRSERLLGELEKVRRTGTWCGFFWRFSSSHPARAQGCRSHRMLAGARSSIRETPRI